MECPRSNCSYDQYRRTGEHVCILPHCPLDPKRRSKLLRDICNLRAIARPTAEDSAELERLQQQYRDALLLIGRGGGP